MRPLPILLLATGVMLAACDDSGGPSAGPTGPATGGPTGPATGSIRVAATTGGIDLDPDGYAVRVDDSQSQAVGINASATFADVTVGDHDVELTGVAANCAITGANPRTLAVSAGSTATAMFQVTCAGTSVIEVTASTTGLHPDADGYIVTVDGGQKRPIAANGTEVFTGLAPGDHEVKLSGVGNHCTLEGMNPRTLAVSVGSTASTTFQVTCAAAFEGRIAFASSGDIYVLDADGADPVNLTKTGSGNLGPAWSPDGTRIAFASALDIFVMNADGSNPVNLTKTGTLDLYPAWSPDGTRIAFASHRDQAPGRVDIFVMNADGSNPVNLTFMEEGSGSHRREPAWSPDGTRIAFTYSVDIYVMDADGSNVVNLSDLILPNISEYIFAPIFGSPAWSPDGTRIAFSLSDDICCADIYVVDADGSNPVNLTKTRSGDFDPAWSPDGRRIAHSRHDSPGGPDIYVMDADGTNLIRLTAGTGSERSPAWAP